MSDTLKKTASTTKLLTKEKPVVENRPEDKFETVLFLPKGENRKGEGGLRSKGYFKKSYEDKPLISIVTVVFNGVEYLEQTIQSVINQTYDNVEYIIIDGGSTDGTLDIIKKYEDQIDYWVSEKDGGIYDAMNKGLFLVTGEWIAFMNGGDSYYIDDTLQSLIEHSRFSDIVYGGRNNIYNGHNNIVDANNFSDRKFSLPFCHQSCIIKVDLHKEYPYDLTFKIHADVDFFYKVYYIGSRFIRIDEVVANFTTDGISSVITANARKERKKILYKHNKGILFKIKLYIWELKRIFTYNIKKLPFSSYLIRMKHYIENKIRQY